MRDEKFSRDVSKSFYYSVEFASNERYIAFGYAVQDALTEGLLRAWSLTPTREADRQMCDVK
jgi:hypothetical protein